MERYAGAFEAEDRARIVETMRGMDGEGIVGRVNRYPSVAGALWVLLRFAPDEEPASISREVIQFYVAAASVAIQEKIYPRYAEVTAVVDATRDFRDDDVFDASTCASWLLTAALRLMGSDIGRDFELPNEAVAENKTIGAAFDVAAGRGMALWVPPGLEARLAGALCAGVYAECRPHVEALLRRLVVHIPPGRATRWDMTDDHLDSFAQQTATAYVDSDELEGAFRPPYLPAPDAPDAGPGGYVCVVCHETGVLRLAEPCGHLAVCARCAAASPGAPCPICRGSASYRVIFESAVRAPAEAP